MRKFGADSAAQLVSQVVEPSQVFGRLTEKSRKAMIAALKPFAVGPLIDIVKYANDSAVADLAYQLSAVLRDAGWKPTEYMRSSYEPLSGLLIEIDPKNPPTQAAADALLFCAFCRGIERKGASLVSFPRHRTRRTSGCGSRHTPNNRSHGLPLGVRIRIPSETGVALANFPQTPDLSATRRAPG